MNKISFRTDKDLSLEDLLSLYESVGWVSYTKSPETLSKAICGSTFVVTAWEDSKLIGLARCLSDDASIMYLQDILVKPHHQSKGVGKQLMTHCLSRFSHVRQRVLITDDTAEQKRFYSSCGFKNTNESSNPKINCYVYFAN